MLANDLQNAYNTYFKHIDLSKFKSGVDPKQIYNMLTWMSVGYLFEKQRLGVAIDIDEMMIEFNSWKNMFIKIAYKEEFQ